MPPFTNYSAYCARNTIFVKIHSHSLQSLTFSILFKPQTLSNVSGNVDTWPAHATGRYISDNMVTMTKDKRLVVVNEEIRGRPSMVPKPRFLEQLEGYLQRELVAHNVQQVAASPVRLQIHREVFEYLIEAFKAYKPLMSAIKREYEMMLSALREQVRTMEPMREMLWTLSQECDRRVTQLREEEKQGMCIVFFYRVLRIGLYDGGIKLMVQPSRMIFREMHNKYN